jgi:hypothetical protein
MSVTLGEREGIASCTTSCTTKKKNSLKQVPIQFHAHECSGKKNTKKKKERWHE